jgi:hypothetical protein
MGYYERPRRGSRREESSREGLRREESRRRENREEVFEKFNYFVWPSNVSGAVDISISNNANNPTVLASLRVRADRDDAIWLNATIGWLASSGTTHVLFKIWKDAPLTGTLVTSALVGGESGFERNYVTSFSHVDVNLSSQREHIYFLTAEVVTANTSANVIGPITFTASTIELQ